MQNPLALDDVSQPQPDIAVLKSWQDFYSTVHPGPADVLLVIDVADSSLAFDLGVEMPLYAAYDIPEVWVVDAATRRTHRFRRSVTHARLAPALALQRSAGFCVEGHRRAEAGVQPFIGTALHDRRFDEAL